MTPLDVPAELEGHELIASVSGGKDSTAMMLALRESGIPHRCVFADTGWEAPETYEYLDLLRDRLGVAIDVVGVEGGMEGRVMYRAGFPARTQRWCTRVLKINPIRDYHAKIDAETGRPTAVVIGVRAQESAKRAALSELDMEADGPRAWGWKVWRPLISWTVEDVLRAHHRHNVPVNPLYRAGFGRVGCWPCIFSNKAEIRLLAEFDPGRIDEVARLEKQATEERERRNAETPGRYTHPRATFFQGGRPPVAAMPTIHEIVSWAKTSRGGRQLPLIPEPHRGGCYRWGLCEPLEGGDQ